MTPEHVELRTRGRLTPRTAAAFSELRITAETNTTLTTRDDDDARSLLRALRALGGEIVTIRRLEEPLPEGRAGAQEHAPRATTQRRDGSPD